MIEQSFIRCLCSLVSGEYGVKLRCTDADESRTMFSTLWRGDVRLLAKDSY
jgi:hypothetical protein